MVAKDFLHLFQGRRVLVTGDTGFKGSWLALWLKELGSDVVGYSLPSVQSEDHSHSVHLENLIHHVDGDVRDFSQLARVAEKFQPEFIFHLAAQSLVRTSYEEPKLTFDTNIIGSVNILEITRKLPSVRTLIYVTSDKCYQNQEWIWGYREGDPLGGRDPYSASKAAAEIVFEAYLRSFFKARPNLGVASVRAGNVIGGGDWAQDRLVPDCIRALESSRPVLIRNPTSKRPWQHVLEPLSGYLQLAAALHDDPKQYSGAWNFGPTKNSFRTVTELAQKVVAYWGGGEIMHHTESQAPHEASLLHLNCDKAHQILGWHPRWTFETAVGETVAWYKKQLEKGPMNSLSLKQIHQYTNTRAIYREPTA